MTYSQARNALKLQCLHLVHQDRGRAAAEAVAWLKTYCRHWATVGHDTQTMDNLNNAERILARQHLGTLRRLGMLKEGGFRGNFEVVDKPA
jgi:kynurenine formamidase